MERDNLRWDDKKYLSWIALSTHFKRQKPFKEILDLDFYDKKGCLHRTKPKLLPAMRDGQHNSIWKVGQVLG